MSNLFHAKKFLLLDEVSQYLSKYFEQSISVADVIRLALDSHLQLSINFFNNARVLKGKLIPVAYADYEVECDKDEGNLCFYDVCYVDTFNHKTKENEIIKYKPTARKILKDDFFNFDHVFRIEEERSTNINGLWDLIVTPSSRHHLESKYLQMTIGVEKKPILPDVIYITNEAGEVYQLLKYFFNKETQDNKKSESEIAKKIRNINNNLVSERVRFSNCEYCFPLGIEWDSGILVVKPGSLTDYLNSFESHPSDLPNTKEPSAINKTVPSQLTELIEAEEVQKIGRALKKKYPDATTTDLCKYANELAHLKKGEKNSRRNTFIINNLIEVGIPAGRPGVSAKPLKHPKPQ